MLLILFGRGGRMSLDVTLWEIVPTDVYSDNITHNLTKMAKEAGLYHTLWRPEEVGHTFARDLIEPLTIGLAKLKADPEHFKKFDAPNKWGVYENFVPFVESYLKACKKHPNATVSVSR